MTDFESWQAQLDRDRPDWAVEFARESDLRDACLRVLRDPGEPGAAWARTMLRRRTGSHLWAAVQAWHAHHASQAPKGAPVQLPSSIQPGGT